jgi:Domain of unknown function (DUF1902)
LVFVAVAGWECGSGASDLSVIRPVVVDVAHDPEAHVWIGMSAEATGFACEGKTLSVVFDKSSAMIADLVELRELPKQMNVRKVKLNRLSLKEYLVKFDL